jgi:hypothetical protein
MILAPSMKAKELGKKNPKYHAYFSAIIGANCLSVFLVNKR